MCGDCRLTLLPLHCRDCRHCRRNSAAPSAWCAAQHNSPCSVTRIVSFIERSHCYTGQPVCMRTLCRIERGRYAFSVPGTFFHQRTASPFGLQQQALVKLHVRSLPSSPLRGNAVMRRIIKRFVNAPAILFRAISRRTQWIAALCCSHLGACINRVGSMGFSSRRLSTLIPLDHGSAMGRCIGVYGKTPHADAVNVKRPPAGSRLFDAS